MSGLAAMLSQRPILDALYILLLTGFLDALELSFGRILRFGRTLRFWLYFVLHYGLACLASYLLSDKIPQWYLLGFVGSFLGVGLLSNSDFKLGGQSIVPVGQLFTTIKFQIVAQAAEDLAGEVARAMLIERLQRLRIATLEAAFRAARLAAGATAEAIAEELQRAKAREPSYVKDYLIQRIIKVNQRFAEAGIAQWEALEASSP